MSNSSIVCSCSHLTSFAAFLEESEQQTFLESCEDVPENCVDGEVPATPPAQPKRRRDRCLIRYHLISLGPKSGTKEMTRPLVYCY